MNFTCLFLTTNCVCARSPFFSSSSRFGFSNQVLYQCNFLKHSSHVLFNNHHGCIVQSTQFHHMLDNSIVFHTISNRDSIKVDTEQVLEVKNSNFVGCFSSTYPGAAICVNNENAVLITSQSRFINCIVSLVHTLGTRSGSVGGGAVAFSGKEVSIICSEFHGCYSLGYGNAVFCYTSRYNKQKASYVSCSNCCNQTSYGIVILMDVGTINTSYINISDCVSGSGTYNGCAIHFGLSPNSLRCDYCTLIRNTGKHLFWFSCLSSTNLYFTNMVNNSVTYYISVDGSYNYFNMVCRSTTGSIYKWTTSAYVSVQNSYTDTNFNGANIATGCITGTDHPTEDFPEETVCVFPYETLHTQRNPHHLFFLLSCIVYTI